VVEGARLESGLARYGQLLRGATNYHSLSRLDPLSPSPIAIHSRALIGVDFATSVTNHVTSMAADACPVQARVIRG
jgi:hypothetical protein